MKYPLVSIAIATLNSERALSKVLQSIKKQNYPKEKIEILVIDGGSSDYTLNIAKNFKAKIIPNPKIDQVYAKKMGYNLAKGKYLMFLDSDEELINESSIKLKVLALLENPKMKAITSSGYKEPKGFSQINFYINEFGDPFSFFLYRESKGYDFFLKDLVKNYGKESETKDYVIFNFSQKSKIPFIELTSMGVMTDLEYVKEIFPEVFKETSTHTHLFYLLLSKGSLFGVTKNDPIVHYSVATFGSYLKKISSRIKNNVYGTSMGKAGFKGREKYTANKSFKKFLFIPYSLSIIFPLMDSIYLYFMHKKVIYLMHVGLCLYTALSIIYFYSLKTFNIKVNLVGYGK